MNDTDLTEDFSSEIDNGLRAETFLEHYGIKGMQWGVRREHKKLKKEVRSEKFKKFSSAMKDEVSKRSGEIAKLKSELSALENKPYDSNNASSRNKHYDAIDKKAEELSLVMMSARMSAGKIATDHIISKYGIEKLKEIDYPMW